MAIALSHARLPAFRFFSRSRLSPGYCFLDSPILAISLLVGDNRDSFIEFPFWGAV